MDIIEKVREKVINELEERSDVVPSGKQLDIISMLSNSIEALTIINALEDYNND